MGAAGSCSRDTAHVEQTAVQKQLTAAVQRHASSQKKLRSLDELLVRLPSLRATFNGCRSTFDAAAGANHRVAASAFHDLSHKLDLPLSVEQQQALFSAADLQADGQLTWSEFVVLLCLAWLLVGEKAGSAQLANLDTALHTLLASWAFFDRDNKGYLTKEDVKLALKGEDVSHHGHLKQHKAPHGSTAVAARFSELDFDGSGRITFPAWILGFESWAGLDEGAYE
jgi:calcium-binding protein CML